MIKVPNGWKIDAVRITREIGLFHIVITGPNLDCPTSEAWEFFAHQPTRPGADSIRRYVESLEAAVAKVDIMLRPEREREIERLRAQRDEAARMLAELEAKP